MEELPIFNIPDIQIPPRSSFYRLEPIGLGTAQVESGTSFLSRLANAHMVSIDTLVSELGLGGENYIKDGLDTSYYSTYAVAINGFHQVATEFVRLMGAKTLLKDDLQYMTLLPLANVLNWHALLRNKIAWCTQCLKEWKNENKTNYYPLLWVLENYNFCHIHKISLQKHCGVCLSSVNNLDRKAPPGYCQHCEGWLGIDLKNDPYKSLISDDKKAWDLFSSNSLAELISKTHLLDFKKMNLTNNFNWYLEKFFQGHYRDFAEYFTIPTTTAWDWCHGTTPSLEEQLRFCYNADISIVQFLSKDIKAATLGEIKKLSKKFVRRHTIIIDEIKKMELQYDLEKALRNTPMSLTTLSVEIGVSKKTLYRHFPSLTKELSSRYREHKKMEAHKKREKELQTLRNLIRNMASWGERPTRVTMKEYLQRPPKVKERWIQDEYRKFCLEQFGTEESPR